jgi:hypothetical protein
MPSRIAPNAGKIAMASLDDFNRSFEGVCLRQKLERLLCASASSGAFWPVLSLALADRRGPHRQSHLILLAVSALSLDQPLVGQALSSDAINEALKPRQGMVLHIAFVEPEGELIDIAAKVLRAGVVVDANQATLENSEHTFNPVRGHIVANIFARAVVDRGVFKTRTLDADICASFIGVQDRAGFNVLVDSGLDRLFVVVRNRHADGATATFAHSEDGSFANRAASRLELLGLVFVLFDPADVGFINFDDTFELGQIIAAAGFPQPMQHEPSRLLRDADLLGELHRRNALARRHKQIHRVNPLVQGNVAALEYRASTNREVLLALVAAVVTASPHRDPIAHAANRALRAIRPKPPFKVGPRGFLVREHLEKLERRNGALGHGLTPDLLGEYAPENRGSQVYNSRIFGASSAFESTLAGLGCS